MSRAVVLSLAVGACVLIALFIWPWIAYPGVPHEIAADLGGRGCRVIGMVVSSFTSSNSVDRAVLCQSGNQVSLLVYTADGGKPAVLANHPAIVEKDPEMGRHIRPVAWDYVMQHNPGLGVRATPVACLEDGIGMGSTLYCYLEGSWVGLTGAD